MTYHQNRRKSRRNNSSNGAITLAKYNWKCNLVAVTCLHATATTSFTDVAIIVTTWTVVGMVVATIVRASLFVICSCWCGESSCLEVFFCLFLDCFLCFWFTTSWCFCYSNWSYTSLTLSIYSIYDALFVWTLPVQVLIL